MSAYTFLTILVFSAVFGLVCCVDDRLREELYIKPLQNGHIYSHFEFKTLWNTSYDDNNFFTHFRLFPKQLGEVLKTWGVEELHLTQTHGAWRGDKWGYPIEAAPTGAQLWVWFHRDTLDVDNAWKNLINILSGMFCASLNFMDATSTVQPRWSYRPEGVSSHGGYKGFMRYSALPREMVCTENLTPWKKLLPCGARSGLGVLFNAIKLYDASYSSLGIHYRSTCQSENQKECTKTAVELKQTLSVVFDPTISSRTQDWSFKRTYNRMVNRACPLASTSRVYVDLSRNRTAEYFFTLTPEPQTVEKYQLPGGQVGKVATYNVGEQCGDNRVFNLAAKYNKNVEYKSPPPPLVYASQFQTGYGQEKGGVICLLYNHHPTMTLPVVYMQALPWFLRTYVHTLTVDHYPAGTYMSTGGQGNITKPRNINYVPGRDHQQAYFLELTLDLPPNSVTRLRYEFDRALLKWTEYPPDANHGFYVNSAVITTPLPPDWALPRISDTKSLFYADEKLSVLRIYTEHLLVTLPTPDFSMPYNVICLACTVVAIAFGSIHNLTTRRFVLLDPTKQVGLLGKVKAMLSKFRKSKPEGTTEESK